MTRWPELDYPAWADTCAALHLWSQIIGKYRLANAPWLNHSWNATLYVTPRGLTTGPVPVASDMVVLSFDLIDHRLVGETASDGRESFALEAMSVADFYARTEDLVDRLGLPFSIHGSPNELPDATPFREDTQRRPYDADAVSRFHRALVRVDGTFARFRTGFLGKSSPSHLFWGSFDLAVTRFSGRTAPRHPGGIPNLPDIVTREAYSHEVSSAGFWPGGGGVDEAMFYAYAYPVPDEMAASKVMPDEAYWNADLGEFLLPYEVVRKADDPEAKLLAFLQSTYEAAARTADWDPALECPLGRAGQPRPLAR